MACFAMPAIAVGFQAAPNHQRERPEAFKRPCIIEFHDEINFRSSQYFQRKFAAARRQRCDLIIVDIDSPGGLRDQSLKMARKLRDCKWAYTIAIVNNEAISGGALMAIGCDEIHIAPDARFGDIGEITFDPERWAWRLMEPKVESYLSRIARDLAESKGRSPDLAESMIDSEVLVFVKDEEVEERTKKVFRQVRVDEVRPDAPWELVPESGPERFLTVNGMRLVELEFAQGHDSSREEIAKAMGVELADVNVFQPTALDSVIYYLQLSWVKALLIILGMVALYIELSAPGVGVGGLVAGMCAVLFFWASFLAGTAGALEVILFVAGLVFLAMEIFVIPGFGVSGGLGLLFLFSSVMLAGQDFIIPRTAEQINQSFLSLSIITFSIVVFLVLAVLITRHLGSIPIFNQLVLNPDDIGAGGQEDKKSAVTQTHPVVSVGDWGMADSVLRPAGRAKFNGKIVDVISDGSFIDPGTQVRVIAISGNVVTVSVVEDEDGE